MQKYKKKQILKVFHTMERAHVAMEKVIGQRNVDLTEVLSELQNSAFELGTELEKEIGEDHEIILLLEAYCEFAWQLNQAKNRQEKKQALKSMKQSLREIKAKIKEEIKEKSTLVFLPYKASMWDSMESIWKAAKENPACEAIVMPIPYYEKAPDGALEQMHYEGNLLGEVPIVNWEEINLEELHPEAIIFHNPYDEGNLVTSVHPLFYSKSLYQYTEKLIYIPYGGVAITDFLESCCTTNGAVQADRIYVASKKAKVSFEKAFNMLRGKTKSPLLDSEKVIVAGHPKIDKVENVLNYPELYPCPEEWKAFLYDETGNKKLSVFYNVSIEEILEHDQKYIDYMAKIFQYFNEIEDVVLWWRPHPLLKSTLKTMKPHLCQRYIELESFFMEEKIGIYDRLPQYHAALALTDGYLGEGGSSIAALYGLTGKPIFILNLGNKINIQQISLDEQLKLRNSNTLNIASQYQLVGENINDLNLYIKAMRGGLISEKQKDVFHKLYYRPDNKTSGEYILADILNFERNN